MQINTADFLTWVKAQPPDETFNFQSVSDCASCRYLWTRLPAKAEVAALITSYSVRLDSCAPWEQLDFPDVLAETFDRFGGGANGDFRYLISYGDLAAEIEATIASLKNKS